MRNHYNLKKGRPNPYATRIGARGRRAMIQALVLHLDPNLRRLDDELARRFPDSGSVNEALRLLARMGDLAAKVSSKGRPRKRAPRRAA
jgi:hypothetical protein